MLQEHKTNTNLGIGFGIVLLSVANFSSKGTFSPFTTQLIALGGLALYLWGGASYALGKGHSGWWAIVLFIPFLGLIILVALTDHHDQRARPVSRGRSSWGITLLLVLLLFFGLAGWRAFHAPHPRSVAEAQAQAVKSYPQLSVLNSPLNHEFVTRYKRYQATNKDYFKNPDWPLALAAECQSAINPTSNSR
ncbi:MAG: hypothetical protein ABJF10_27025 [Chthoniobacter sp.]|uniref:hypothetical protein n=1 Tax=Chthoniobacter sp. TaxID=2510640 RepID=UPI0032A37ABC